MSPGRGESNAAAERDPRAAVRSGCGLAALLGLFSIVLVGCGAPAAVAKGSNIAASVRSRSATCQAVAADLTDGPDAGEDPVGYAEAQVRPLRAITTQSAPLRSAIDRLAEAYASEVAVGANSTTTVAVTTAQHLVDALCPGVTS